MSTEFVWVFILKIYKNDTVDKNQHYVGSKASMKDLNYWYIKHAFFHAIIGHWTSE